MNKFQTLFETVNISRVTPKNRIAMAPMGINGFMPRQVRLHEMESKNIIWSELGAVQG
jgi:2,4-dienoyl-CoA reductase-like NADH-dependent reductase (Old Yellow Enzyme family)